MTGVDAGDDTDTMNDNVDMRKLTDRQADTTSVQENGSKVNSDRTTSNMTILTQRYTTFSTAAQTYCR